MADTITTDGGTALPVFCDVSDESSVEAAVARTTETLGPIDILVANAGTLWMGTDPRHTPQTLGPVPAGQPHRHVPGDQGGAAVGHGTPYRLVDRHHHHRRLPDRLGSNAYWVSKAGIERYYAGLATELAPYGVAVNCLAPKKVVMTEGAVAGRVRWPPT